MSAGSQCQTAGSGRALLGVRIARNLSRERLASLAGLSPRTIYAIETGAVRPQRATVLALSLALQCTVHDLTDDHEPVPSGLVERKGDETARPQA